MKTLLLLRHAKSDKDIPDINDHDRPLNERGLKAAPRMGQLIQEKNLIPDLILSSTANRAHTTAQLVAQACGYKKELRLDHSLYSTSPGQYMKILQKLDDGLNRVMIVGHNPEMEHAVQLLTNQEEHMSTAALAVIELPIEQWKDLHMPYQGNLLHLWRPKELPEG